MWKEMWIQHLRPSGPPREAPEDIEAVRRCYETILGHMEEVFAALRGGKVPELDQVGQDVCLLLRDLREGDLLLTQVLMERKASSLEAHSANVGILTLKMGLTLGFPEDILIALGLTALLHDLGMAFLPPKLLEKEKSLSPEELRPVREHPYRTSELFRKLLPSDLGWLAEVVVQEHERVDGSGYPRGLNGEEVHELAQVVGAADTFEAMTHERPYRPRVAAYRALRELIRRRNRDFTSRIVKALVDSVSIFPVGSLVRLNTGEVCRVVRPNRRHPTRPVLRVLLDDRGEWVPEEWTVDLEEYPTLYIVDPAVDEEVVERA